MTSNELRIALQALVNAVSYMKVPQTVEDVALQITATIGPALRAAQDALVNSSVETTAPFTYPTDRVGWICSVCHQWNLPKDKHCSHAPRPAPDLPEEPEARCPDCGLLLDPPGHDINCPRRAVNGDGGI